MYEYFKKKPNTLKTLFLSVFSIPKRNEKLCLLKIIRICNKTRKNVYI